MLSGIRLKGKLQIEKEICKYFFREYGLLLLSVILFTLSLVFNTIYSNTTSVRKETRLLEKYLHRQQNDFSDFLTNTSLLRKLVDKKESLSEFDKLTKKTYGIFIISENVYGEPDTRFWNTQEILPRLMRLEWPMENTRNTWKTATILLLKRR